MNGHWTPVQTDDGSFTLFNPDLQEHYHSKHGAIQESEHVFIKHGLLPKLEEHDHVHLLEVGFGTGLNALLTQKALQQHRNKKITYTGLEPFPPAENLLEGMGYHKMRGLENYQGFWHNMHKADWGHPQNLTPEFTLLKEKRAIAEFNPAGTFDLVYYDAFGPRAQPEMWNEEHFSKLYKAMASRGVLVTYCANGEFKRALKRSGFAVEALPGPPGKREMTRAVR